MVSFCSTSWPGFLVDIFLEYCHSDMDQRKSQCSYDVHFHIAKDIEHFLIYLSVMCISSSENPIFNSICYWMLGFWVFIEIVIYSRNSVVCVVTLIIFSLDVQKVFNLKSCSENYFLCLHLPLFSLCSPVVLSKFQIFH
jgi:hypothetical protein